MLFAALLALGFTSVNAQEKESFDFNPHWYIQAQGGGQYTTGETSFNKLLSPNVQLSAGYQITPVWGLRLGVNGWQSKGASDFDIKQNNVKVNNISAKWSWNYVAPMLDATADLTNLFGGFKPNRAVSVGILAGVGANVGFNNGEAYDAKKDVHQSLLGTNMTIDPKNLPVLMTSIWDGTKVRFTGRVGATVDFRINDNLKIGLEGQMNILSDAYNSKNAPGNCDYYYNALVGIKYAFGKTHAKKVQPAIVDAPATQTVTRVIHDTVYVEKRVEVPVQAKPAVREPLRRDIFFLIRGSVIDNDEMKKVDEVVAYLNKYPEAKVTVTGYADKGTGNAQLNIGYSKKRADVVANTLKKRGIAANRIIVNAKGDTEQPYAENDKNRVTICIAE